MSIARRRCSTISLVEHFLTMAVLDDSDRLVDVELIWRRREDRLFGSVVLSVQKCSQVETNECDDMFRMSVIGPDRLCYFVESRHTSRYMRNENSAVFGKGTTACEAYAVLVLGPRAFRGAENKRVYKKSRPASD